MSLLDSPQPQFGMDVTLTGLKDRGYLPDVVFDIGAADGSWTRHALKIWPNARYVCFEPLVERLAALDTLVAERNSQVSIQPYGIGNADCELSLGVTDFLWDSSFAYGGNSARNVTVRKLDSLFVAGLIPRPSFVKIDVQGFEKRVIEGGENALSNTDFVLMECTFIAFCDEMRTLDKSIAFMSERGFIPYEFVDFLRRPLDGAMGQCDILFARHDHALVSDRRWAA
jgi:FkbM family methyltransferase